MEALWGLMLPTPEHSSPHLETSHPARSQDVRSQDVRLDAVVNTPFKGTCGVISISTQHLFALLWESPAFLGLRIALLISCHPVFTWREFRDPDEVVALMICYLEDGSKEVDFRGATPLTCDGIILNLRFPICRMGIVISTAQCCGEN